MNLDTLYEIERAAKKLDEADVELPVIQAAIIEAWGRIEAARIIAEGAAQAGNKNRGGYI